MSIQQLPKEASQRKAMKLRFTIRDLLWLTAVSAVGVAWWLDHKQLAKSLLITEAGGVFYERDDRGDWHQIENMMRTNP